MSQNDFNLANQGFPAMRADMNSAFQALASNSSGATEPGTTYAYQWWYDTNNDILKMRNADDDAWINIASFDQVNDLWLPSAGGVPAGSVIWSAANSPPTGYLKANGAAVSRATYADLFAAIGTTFGVGDGSTTFALPDLRGEFVRGWDDSRGVDSGRSFGSAQADATAVNGLSATTTATINILSPQPNTGGTHDLARGPSAGSVTITSSDTETRPRNVALLACIKF